MPRLQSGACDPATDRLVAGVTFASKATMRWDPESGALSYRVYRKITTGSPPDDAGTCLLPLNPLTQPTINLAQAPPPGGCWFLQVAAVFADGEGSLGTGSNCRARQPAVSCP